MRDNKAPLGVLIFSETEHKHRRRIEKPLCHDLYACPASPSCMLSSLQFSLCWNLNSVTLHGWMDYSGLFFLQCSTSCGLGAVWRIVICSSGVESDCDPLSKPAPARRCYLRPCSAWRVGNWSKVRLALTSKPTPKGTDQNKTRTHCSYSWLVSWFGKSSDVIFDPVFIEITVIHSEPLPLIICWQRDILKLMFDPALSEIACLLDQVVKTDALCVVGWEQCSRNCGGGEKEREVQCYDMRDQRVLRPFHCQAVSSRPPSQASCNIQPCFEWFTSSWGQVTRVPLPPSPPQIPHPLFSNCLSQMKISIRIASNLSCKHLCALKSHHIFLPSVHWQIISLWGLANNFFKKTSISSL